MADEENFEVGDAGQALTYPLAAGSVKVGAYCMLKGFPCKVVSYSTSKAGKHGHAKASIAGDDIFTGKRVEDSCPTSHNMEIPFVKKTEYQIIDVQEDGFVHLMADDGEVREDLKLPEDEQSIKLVEEIRSNFEADKEVYVIVQGAMNQEKIISTRIKE